MPPLRSVIADSPLPHQLPVLGSAPHQRVTLCDIAVPLPHGPFPHVALRTRYGYGLPCGRHYGHSWDLATPLLTCTCTAAHTHAAPRTHAATTHHTTAPRYAAPLRAHAPPWLWRLCQGAARALAFTACLAAGQFTTPALAACHRLSRVCRCRCDTTTTCRPHHPTTYPARALPLAGQPPPSHARLPPAMHRLPILYYLRISLFSHTYHYRNMLRSCLHCCRIDLSGTLAQFPVPVLWTTAALPRCRSHLPTTTPHPTPPHHTCLCVYLCWAICHHTPFWMDCCLPISPSTSLFPRFLLPVRATLR